MPSEAASGGRPRARDRLEGLRRRSTRCPPADPPAEPTRRPGHVGCDRRDRPSVSASTSPGGAASRVAGSPRGREGPEAGQAQPLSVRRRSRPPAISGPAQQSAGGRPLRGSARPCRAWATPAHAHRRRACSSTCVRARRGRSSTDRPLHAPPTREPNSWAYRIRSDTSQASRRRRRCVTRCDRTVALRLDGEGEGMVVAHVGVGRETAPIPRRNPFRPVPPVRGVHHRG